MQHKNIVSLLDIFHHKQRLCLVFDFVKETLLQWLERSPCGIPEASVKLILWQLVQAISYLHSQGILHRDIKPENLLVSSDGVLKLCDFGFARRCESSGISSGKYTSYVATRWYRAPELLLQPGKYGFSVDIWAIGCLAAEMLTGRPAFPGNTDADQLSRILACTGPIPSLERKDNVAANHANRIIGVREKYDGVCSEGAIAFLERCLVGDPDLRSTAAQLLSHPWILDGMNEWIPFILQAGTSQN